MTHTTHEWLALQFNGLLYMIQRGVGCEFGLGYTQNSQRTVYALLGTLPW